MVAADQGGRDQSGVVKEHDHERLLSKEICLPYHRGHAARLVGRIRGHDVGTAVAHGRRRDRQQLRPSADVRRCRKGVFQEAWCGRPSQGRQHRNGHGERHAEARSTDRRHERDDVSEGASRRRPVSRDRNHPERCDPIQRRRAARDRRAQGLRHPSGQHRGPQGQADRGGAGADLRRVPQDGLSQARNEVRRRHDREHHGAAGVGPRPEGGQGRRGRLLGAIQHRGARSGAGIVYRRSRRRLPLVHHGRDRP